jgi:hypothetical protein
VGDELEDQIAESGRLLLEELGTGRGEEALFLGTDGWGPLSVRGESACAFLAGGETEGGAPVLSGKNEEAAKVSQMYADMWLPIRALAFGYTEPIGLVFSIYKKICFRKTVMNHLV